MEKVNFNAGSRLSLSIKFYVYISFTLIYVKSSPRKFWKFHLMKNDVYICFIIPKQCGP